MAAHRRPIVTAGAAAALVAGLLLAVPAAQAAPEDLPGRLVLAHTTFAPGQPDDARLVTTTPAGTDRQDLIDIGSGEQLSYPSRPDWSPDGSRVTFVDHRAATHSDVWVADADFTDPVRLASRVEYEESPTWSPDGTTIAYIRYPDEPPYTQELRLMDADGGNDRLLMEWSEEGSLAAVSWHPSEPTLVVQAGLSIYTVDVEDPTAELLFTSPGSAIDLPAWSPDGNTLAVAVEVTGVNFDIFMIDPDDGSAVNYTDTPGKAEFSPTWSPDGAALAWGGWDGPFVPTGIWVHELDSGTTTNVLPIDPNTEAYNLHGWVSSLPEPPGDPDDVDTDAEPGETVGTDPEGDGATPDDPVETSVTTPVAGPVTIDEGPVSGAPPAGYAFFGQQVAITAPTATAADPLVLTFRVDASALPAGTGAADVVPFRNGVTVPVCTGAAGVAAPDPCRASAVLEGDGDVTVTVLTSAASAWNLGVSTTPPDTTPPAIAVAAPVQGASYGRDQAVVVDFACTDASRIDRCAGTRPDGALLGTATIGSAIFRVEAEDAAGNTATSAVGYRVVARRTLTPAVTCVIRGSGGWWTARFGYTNRNAYPLSLPVGTRNGFTPTPANRAQPTYFVPGTVTNAVQVQFRTTIGWRLDGTTATARTSTRRC